MLYVSRTINQREPTSSLTVVLNLSTVSGKRHIGFSVWAMRCYSARAWRALTMNQIYYNDSRRLSTSQSAHFVRKNVQVFKQQQYVWWVLCNTSSMYNEQRTTEPQSLHVCVIHRYTSCWHIGPLVMWYSCIFLPTSPDQHVHNISSVQLEAVI
jgi:hypothetical protein